MSRLIWLEEILCLINTFNILMSAIGLSPETSSSIICTHLNWLNLINVFVSMGVEIYIKEKLILLFS